MPPKVIGPYRVLETLGSGGVGTVYRALDRRNGETVALKVLSTGPTLDPRAARRLAREFEALEDLSHPNVVKVFDTGVFQGYPYLTMELVEGLTLRHYLSLDPAQDSSSWSRSGGRRVPHFEFIADGDSDSWEREAEHGHEASAGDGDASEEGSNASSNASSNDGSEEGSEDGSSELDSPFDLEAFAEEAPSEDFDSGPDSVRRLADELDEPDTESSVSGVSLPPDLGPSAPPPERTSGVDLDQLNRPERVGRLKDAMLQLCQALSYIHAKGLVHRDLKPSNVMVDEDRQVRLMDFGLAKFLADDGAVTQNGRLVGTFRYMPPEQILGEKLDGRADLYSLGVILYELLTGRPPFDAKTPYELWQKVLETEAPSVFQLNSRADPQIARIAHRLMRKEPDDRFQTAEEVYEALSE